MSLERDEQLKEQAYDDCTKGFCPNVDDPYSNPTIRCVCGYIGPGHRQTPMMDEMWCKLCKRWMKPTEIRVPDREWRGSK